MVKKELEESFTKMERHCGNHKQDDQHKCYCDITGDTYNKYGCPRMRGRDNLE